MQCKKCDHYAVCMIRDIITDADRDACPHFKGWISVKDRLPDARTPVLAIFTDGFMMQCCVPFNPLITHWQSKPAPPKGGAK